jgi:small redox-active disulfide protein 2
MNNQITSIKVLGSGCPTCKKLFELTQKAVAELNLQTKVEYVTDVQKIIDLGVMSTPVLTINGKVALVGQVPGIEKIKELIGSGSRVINEESVSACSCGGKC